MHWTSNLMEMKRDLVCKSSEAHFTAQYYITYGHSLINNLSVLSTPADVGNVYFPCLFLSVQGSNCLKSAWNLDRACEFCGLRAVEKQWQSVMAWEHSWLEKRPRIDARLRGFAEMAWIWSWKECIWYVCCCWRFQEDERMWGWRREWQPSIKRSNYPQVQ